MALRWSHRAAERPTLFHVLRVCLDGSTVEANLQALSQLGTAIGLVPTACGNAVVIDTSVLPHSMLSLTYIPRTVARYKRVFPLLKRYVDTTVLIVNNSTMRALINTVLTVMPETATRVVTVATAEEAEKELTSQPWAAASLQ